jgi:hypothetical protein
MKFVELPSGLIINLDHVVYFGRGVDDEWEICFDVTVTVSDEPGARYDFDIHRIVLDEADAQEFRRRCQRHRPEPPKTR